MWKTQSQAQKSSIERKALENEVLPSADAHARKEQELRERVRSHKIHWQAWPEYHGRGSERRHVGFRLDLLGTHDRPSTRPISRCPESWKVYTSLHELARWILPEEGESDLQVSVDSASLMVQGDLRDIMVTIKISHQHGFGQTVDALEVLCLATIKERLCELGARQDQPA